MFIRVRASMCNALSRHERRAGRERKRASMRQGNCSDKKKLSNLSHEFAPPLSPPLSHSKKQKNRLFETKLEQYDYAGATAVAVVMLGFSFVMLLVINGLQAWQRKRAGASS